jgi:hypothetical protein
MSYTRAQLVNKALSKLGVIAEGQAVSDGDVLKMDSLVDAAMAMLAALGIYTVADYGQLGPSDGAIEPEAFLPLATWLARTACEDFNQPADTKMVTEAAIAEALLRTLSAPPRSKARLSIDPALRGHGGRGTYGRWPNNG